MNDDVDVQIQQEAQQHLLPANVTETAAEETSAPETKPTKWKHEGNMHSLTWKRARHDHDVPQVGQVTEVDGIRADLRNLDKGEETFGPSNLALHQIE